MMVDRLLTASQYVNHQDARTPLTKPEKPDNLIEDTFLATSIAE